MRRERDFRLGACASPAASPASMSVVVGVAENDGPVTAVRSAMVFVVKSSGARVGAAEESLTKGGDDRR